MSKTGKMFYHISETARLPIIRYDDSMPLDNNDNHRSHQNNDSSKLHLPRPSFRKIDKGEYRKRTCTAAKAKKAMKEKWNEGYFHYEEPDAQTLDQRVEYDMDVQDLCWLADFNENFGRPNDFIVSENDFEKIMDRLEKESYFESQQNQTVDEDAVCSVCNDGDCSNANVILFCDMCDLAVHQECYGVPYIPEGQWLCRRCLQSPLRNVPCALCPNVDGAFKQTNDNRWSHVVCALWIPEVNFANTVFLEPIECLQNIPPDRWKLTCYICKQRRTGACIQCAKKGCYLPFHVTCAQQARLYMKMSRCQFNSPNRGTYTDIKREAFCHKHTPKNRPVGGSMYSGDDTDEDIESESYRKKEDKREKQLKQVKKMLSEKRQDMTHKDTATIKVDESKLTAIAKCFGVRGKKCAPAHIIEMRMVYVKRIYAYWQQKRQQRSGVPLIRRLQVASYNNADPHPDEKLDKDNFERLRYDLERCRLLLGEVKRREQLKKKLFLLNHAIIQMKMDEIDTNDPPEDD